MREILKVQASHSCVDTEDGSWYSTVLMDYHHGEANPGTAAGSRYNVGLVTGLYLGVSRVPPYVLTVLCLVFVIRIAESRLLIHWEENQSWI